MIVQVDLRSSDRLDQSGIVVPDIADAWAHRPAYHAVGRVGGQQRLHMRLVGRLLAEPSRPGLGREDRRHPVMQRGAEFVRLRGLRGGFKKLDPRRIPPDKIEEAASCHAASAGRRMWRSRTCRGPMRSSAGLSRSRAMGGVVARARATATWNSPSCAKRRVPPHANSLCTELRESGRRRSLAEAFSDRRVPVGAPCWNVSPTSTVRTTWPGPLE